MNNCTYQETQFMAQDSTSENHYESAIHLNSTSVTERTSTPCDESKLKRLLNPRNKLLIFSMLGLVLVCAIGFVFGISYILPSMDIYQLLHLIYRIGCAFNVLSACAVKVYNAVGYVRELKRKRDREPWQLQSVEVII